MKLFSCFFQAWSIFWMAVILIVVLLPPTLVSLPFPLKIRLKIIMPFWQLFGHLFLRLVAFSRYVIYDYRPKTVRRKRPLTDLYICNHQSIMDIPLVMTHFQIPAIMKIEVMKIPLFGLLTYAAGGIPVDRSDKDSRRKVKEKCQQRLLEGLPVHYYPEGTRSKDQGRPKPYEGIRTALIEFAYEHDIPVYPASCYGTYKITEKKGLIKPFQPVGMIVHDALKPKDFEDKELFAHACWGKVLEGYQKLKLEIDGEEKQSQAYQTL